MQKIQLAVTLAVASLLLPIVTDAAPSEPRHAVVERIAAPDGGYDYLSIDSARQRLFVGRESGVMAVDLATKKVTAKLLEADDVAAVLIIPGTDLMLATASDADKAILFNRMTGAVQARIATGKAPDAAFHEPKSGLAFVMNADSNDATVIDLKAAKAVATIPMGGKPEAATGDGRGFVYINIEDTAEIAVVEVASRKVVRRLKLAGCVEPTGIAYDAVTDTLISACHNNVAKLTHARTGADRGSVKVGKDADGAIFDAQSRFAYIPCNDGTLTLFQLDAHGLPLHGIQRLRTIEDNHGVQGNQALV